MIFASVVKEDGKKETHLAKGEGADATLCGEGLEGKDWAVKVRREWLTCRQCKELVTSHFRGKALAIDRLIILNRTLERFIQAFQEKSRKCEEKAEESLVAAEELIRTLEAFDCGSYGGHDKYNNGIPNLFMRFEWLVYKYHTPMDLTLADRYEELRKFFAEEVL